MESNRRSKRLASNAPAAEKSSKRLRRPNTSSMAAFDKQKTTVLSRAKGKRKAKRPQAPIPPIEPEPTLPVHPKSNTARPPTPSSPANAPESSPARQPRSKRANAPAPSSPFNPQSMGKAPHNVTLTITPVIDKQVKENDGILVNIDINSPFRNSLEDLHNHVFNNYIKQWVELRKLTPSERPVLSHWTVTIGNPKGQCSRLRVADKTSWENVEIMLRQIEKDGGPEKKTAHRIKIDAIYNCFDREPTPDPITASKGNKARPATVRRTQLDADPSEQSDEEIQEANTSDLEPLPTRDSITRRQLKDKRSRDKMLPRDQLSRKQLFATHKCQREGCANQKGACYYISKYDTHHKLTSDNLDEWAQLVGCHGITIHTPPHEWIAQYLEGFQKMEWKKKSRKSNNNNEGTVETSAPTQPTVTQVAVPQTIQPPPQQAVPYAPQQQLPVPQQYAPQQQFLPQQQPQFAQQPLYQQSYNSQPNYGFPPQNQYHNPYYDQPLYSYSSGPRRQLPLPQAPRPKLPSSPIREPLSEILIGLEEYLIGQPFADEEKAYLATGLQVMKDQCFSLDQLLKEDWVLNVLSREGVRSNMCLQMRRLAREFKTIRKARRDAIEGLTSMNQQSTRGLEFGRLGEGGHAGFFDNY
jgi:hypothetical protein